MKSILQKILAILGRLTIRKYKPMIIGVTGSVGKTSTREAIACVLTKKYRVRQPEKNFNNEIGLPLAILGIQNYGRNILGWLIVFLRVVIRLIVGDRNYPEVLVLEYGIDAPGDMDRLLAIAKPFIGVVTAIGEIPVHVEFFLSADEVAKEKGKLIAALEAGGYAILNGDDPRVSLMDEWTNANVSSFGFRQSADVRVANFDFIFSHGGGEDIAEGVSFKVEYRGSTVPVRLHGALGKPQAYAAVGAVAVGVALGMNLVEISDALQIYVPQPGRMRLIKGINGSLILDDTYNAAPDSIKAGLETLQHLPGKRKIAILGTMAELGEFSEQAHRAVARQAGEFTDLLIGVGAQAKFIIDEIKKTRHDREVSHFFYDDSRAAAKAVPLLIQEGDLILVKGSQSIRMERVVEAIMRSPKDAKEILVRQDKSWKSRT